MQPVVEHHSGAAERPGQGGSLARGWAEAIAVPKLHIDIIFGFMFNIRDIASATYRVVLSSASSALPKDRHRMFTIPGLN
jgi:hypothetical protein